MKSGKIPNKYGLKPLTDRIFSLVVVVATSMASPVAMAARDAAQMIAQEKENRLVAAQKALKKTQPTAAELNRIALPPDHGPRAETTQEVNDRRLERANFPEAPASVSIK